MNIPLIIVMGYVALLFLISFLSTRKAKQGSDEFLFASNKMNTLLVAVTIAGLAIGGASTIGVAENAFGKGLAAGWYNVAWATGAIVVALFIADKYRKLKITTVAEMFEKYYDGKTRVLSVILQIVIQMTIIALQYIAGGAILASMLPDIFTRESGILVSFIIFVAITLIGGMWSASINNIINISLIYIGILLATVGIVSNQGGIAAIKANLPQNVPYFSFVEGLGLAVIFGWVMVMVCNCISLQAVIQISMSAKDSKTAKKGFVIGALLMIPIGFLSALMGIAAKSVAPDMTATLALPKIVMSLNPVIAGITLAGLWAADISTACNLLLGASSLFTKDIYLRVKSNASEKQTLLVNKLTVLVLGLVTYILASSLGSILNSLKIALTLTAGFTVVLIFTIYFPKICRKNSAFYTLIVSIIIALIWSKVPAIKAVFNDLIYLEIIATVVSFVVISFIDKKRIKDINVSHKETKAVNY